MFVQIIEGQTSDAAALTRQGERWQAELSPGAVGFLGVTSGVTADGRAITIVRFESEEAARANSDRPEQGAWWAETAQLYDGDISFTESSDVEEFLGGGSDDAGFVQIMKSHGVDRARTAQLDEQFQKFAGARPDLLGSMRVWTGADSCIEANYFTLGGRGPGRRAPGAAARAAGDDGRVPGPHARHRVPRPHGALPPLSRPPPRRRRPSAPAVAWNIPRSCRVAPCDARAVRARPRPGGGGLVRR